MDGLLRRGRSCSWLNNRFERQVAHAVAIASAWVARFVRHGHAPRWRGATRWRMRGRGRITSRRLAWSRGSRALPIWCILADATVFRWRGGRARTIRSIGRHAHLRRRVRPNFRKGSWRMRLRSIVHQVRRPSRREMRARRCRAGGGRSRCRMRLRRTGRRAPTRVDVGGLAVRMRECFRTRRGM